jgi:hypothetical protein
MSEMFRRGDEIPSTVNHAPPRYPVDMFGFVVIAAWLLFVTAALLPDVGRGFVKDDFSWIATGRAGLADPMSIVRPTQSGFFRPLVAASFAVNYYWFGLAARLYGLTNLVLYGLCAAAIVLLIRQFGVSWTSALVGAFAWAINPHGIGMAVLWISGRTSLLLTLTATLATVAFLRGHRILGLGLFAAALSSKEEAVVLPIMIGALVAVTAPRNHRRIFIDTVAMGMVLVVYFVARAQTPAFTFATAPWFYQPTADLSLVARNVLEYLDRGATIGAILCVLACMMFNRWPQIGTVERRLIVGAGVWFGVGFVPTLFLPVRSSLYAVFPSVGMAMGVAIVVNALRAGEPDRRRDLRFAVALGSVVLLVPIYRVRNRPWVEAARVSSRVMRVVAGDLDGRYTHGVVVLQDEPTRISNLRDAFGPLATEAVRTTTGKALDAVLVLAETPDRSVVRPSDTIAWYRLERGAVRRVE